MKCDVEIVEDKLLELVQSELPAKLAEIQAEKADGVVLDVPTDAQYFNGTDIDEEVINQVMFVKYGLFETIADSNSSATAEVNVYGFLFYFDELNGPQGDVRKKIFRYTRAIIEIFEENFDKFPYLSRLNVGTIAPALWRDNEKSPVYKVGGAYIATSIVA